METDNTVSFTEVSWFKNYVEASLAINPTSSWRPNPGKDRIKLVTAEDETVLNFLTPTITCNEDLHQFNITVDVELLEEVEYRLVYLDQDRNQRGISCPFSRSGHTPASMSLQSSGSFETISDVDEDESSFTVIKRPEDIILNESWQLADTVTGSGSVSSSDDDQSEDEDNNDNDTYSNEVQLPLSMITSNCETKVKIIDSTEIVPTVVDNDVNIPPLPSCELPTEDEMKLPMEMNANFTHASSPVVLELPIAFDPLSNKGSNVKYNEETIMSKSAVLGDEDLLSKAEIKSLQTRNRSHVKKINRLSELLEIEKNYTAELLKTVTKTTAEHAGLLDSIKVLKCELNNVQKRLKRVTQDSEDKDKMIAALKTSNELLRKQLDQQTAVKRKDEQVLPRSDISANDRKCDIGISKPSSGTNEKIRQYRPREHPPHTSNRHRHRHHRHSNHHHENTEHQTAQKSPRRREMLSEFEHVPYPGSSTEKTGSNADHQYICPVCNRRMPSTLTEKQMTVHVESCLKKREA